MDTNSSETPTLIIHGSSINFEESAKLSAYTTEHGFVVEFDRKFKEMGPHNSGGDFGFRGAKATGPLMESEKLLASKPRTTVNNFGVVFVKLEASEEEVMAQVNALHIPNWFPYGVDLVVEVFVTKRLTESFDNESRSPRSMNSLFLLFGEKDD